MMRLKPTALALVLLFALAAGAAALAAEDPVGTAAMLDIGLGARALGMGGAERADDRRALERGGRVEAAHVQRADPAGA